ncbi:NACHT domain- and WD repeat-containing protein 1 [Holothuria leucospilota]|uniref:NACHT domain- and WD repeat-containing protein 1 n=1 Tax=Holothuria leucospilota TaxID=206669 RepID=A0A9Q1BIQ3_HOLLE|nr:NACHT domain- and WD repeat-containing protein 1 [Holothuria leucospilota]
MGSAASSSKDALGLPRSLAAQQKLSMQYWDSFKPHRLALLATIRMKGNPESLWSEPRSERQPWKKILQEAEAAIQKKRQKLGELDDDDVENQPFFRSLIEGSIPDKHVRNAKEVWIFISSTFTDTVLERDTLMEDVYPYIRTYCRKLGLDFNAVDFRWGIRKSLCNQHKAAEICLQEVERCKEKSCGPSFVVILGQKYGFRPVPPVVKMRDFETILRYIERKAESDPREAEALNLIKTWYKLDKNEIDMEYVLQPIDEVLPNFYKDDQAANDEWNKIFTIIQHSLFSAIKGAGLDPDTVHLLTMSITEGEIVEGLEDAKTKEDFQNYIFERTLTNFKENDKFATKFIDVQGNNMIDNDAQNRLQKMKENIKGVMPASNCYRYNLKFLPDLDAMSQDEQNKTSLKNFADQFCSFMINSIQKGAIDTVSATEHPLYSEVLNHILFARERAETFEGREDILENIHKAMELAKVVLVYGGGGCGKTSLLCKAFAESVNQWAGKDDRPFFLLRLVGTTPKSSNIRELLRSLCYQLLACFNIVQNIPTDFKALQKHFASLLERVADKTNLYIFLDSLDQLSNEDNGLDLGWMPQDIPENVCFVLSVRCEVESCLAAAKNLADELVKVLPLGEKDKLNILELLLKKRGRTLAFYQKTRVLQSNNPTALYIRLASDITANWKSYTPIESCNLANTTEGLIEQFFSELETKHGEVFVRSALGYLTASKTGISASELLDVLSCDDVVLDDAFEFHIPPIRRLPPLLWTRLRLDLGPYLVEGGTDNTVLFRWHHRLFHEVAYSRYVADSAPFLHQSLANYFMSRWAETPKPYHDKVNGGVKVAHRRVQAQPLFLNDGPQIGLDEARKYNMRKLNELPTHLINGAMWQEAEQVMCSIPWIEAKCYTGEIYQLLLELDEASKKCEKRVKFRDFYKMIRANTIILQDHPDLVCQQALNEPDNSSCVPVARNFLKLNATKMHCLLNLSKSQSANPEAMTLTHKAAVTVVKFSGNGYHVATACKDGMVRAWRVASGTLEMETEADAIKLAWPGHCHWLAVLNATGIKLVGLGSGGGLARGQVFQNISVELESCLQAFIPKSCKHIFVSQMGRVNIYSTSTGAMIQKKELRCRPCAVAFASNGKLMALAYRNVFLWDITKESKGKEFDTGKGIMDLKNSTLSFSNDSKRLLGVLPNGTFIWNVKGNSCKCIGHPLSLNCMNAISVCSPKLDYIVPLGECKKIEVLRLSPPVEWNSLQGHTAPVLCCDFCIGPEKNTLLVTGSEDKSVRIWDTAAASSKGNVIVQRHEGRVTAGLFSGDGTKAVTSSNQKLYLWDMQMNPPLVYSREVVAISEDALFVAALCGKGGMDIWFEKKTPVVYNQNTIESEHLLIPYANPNYLFIKFTSGLLACFTILNRLGTVLLLQVVSPSAINDWKNQPSIVPTWKEYNMMTTEFVLDPSYQITAACLSAKSELLATLSIKASEDVLHSTLIAGKKTDFLKGPLEVRLWDVFSQNVKIVIPVDGSVTRYHHVSFLGLNPVVFFQEKKKKARTVKGKGTPRDRSVSAISPYVQCIVSVLKQSSGEMLYSTVIEGDYTNIKAADARFIFQQFPVSMQTQMLLLTQEHEGVLYLSKVGVSPVKGKYSHRLIRVACHGLSADNQSVVVGLDDGQVHFLRLAQVGTQYVQ